MTLIFLHIPKTAGTTMRRVLRRIYSRREIFHLKQSWLAGYYLALLDLKTRYRRFDLVMGHFGYGVHRYVHHECRYFTMLREPISRTVSHYHFLQRKKGFSPNKALVASSSGLADLLEEDVEFIANQQTRMLASLDGRSIRGAIGPAELDRAKAHLDQCVVGLTERFDESLLLFAKSFGWPDIRYTRQNVARNKPKELPPDLLARIEALNRYDMELYAHAGELMAERIAVYGADFAKELSEFRRINAKYESAGPGPGR